MSKTIKEERLRWVLPIVRKEIKLKDLAKACPYGQRTLERWAANYRKHGDRGLEPGSTKPKSHPGETPIRIKERVIELRNNNKKCAFKLADDLHQEGININVRTIGKILKVNGLTRKYRTRKLKYRYIKVPVTPGELVEIDVKYVPKLLNNRQYYQFTAIDCSSRWRYLKIYEDYSNLSSVSFLKELVKVAPFKIRAVKTDNGSYFTNRYTGYQKSADPFNPKLHEFDLLCQKMNVIHYLIDPGKPAQNGKVERSHRSDQETFYERTTYDTIEELIYKIRLWNMYYNDLQHCSLNNKTPNQYLAEYNN
jgi:transposase InsO family protein